MSRFFFSAIIILTCLLCVTCKTQVVLDENRTSSSPLARNIIFLVGDGMGIGQISAGTYSNKNYSQLERFPVTGLHKPHASDSLITDSAAAATAFASGVKTYYGAIGVNPDTIPVPTILEEAEERGMKTGLVATSTIVHATPAAFIAHVPHRRDYEDIAADFLETEVDYFVGGGKKYFDRRETDDRDLVGELKARGYIVKDFIEVDRFMQLEQDLMSTDKLAWFTADNSPLSAEQGRDYLPEAALGGVKFLSRQADNGFFIMIEGSQIDWGGHANNQDYIITEFLDFNSTIKGILDWAEEDGETLVVVTADHETGGFTVQPGSTMDSLKTAFTSLLHSGDFVPVFAYGPQAELFSGIYENTAIYHKMRQALGWPDK